MEKNGNALGVPSNIKDLGVGDKVYTSDFTFDGKREFFDTKTFIIDKVNVSHIDGVSDPYYEMHDEKYPKGVIKSDLKTGYFLSEKDAQKAFVDTMEAITAKAKACYESKYGC